METSCWILEGDYGVTMDLRLQAADTILFLDLPTLTCLWRVVKRRFLYADRSRPDMTVGNKERLSWSFLMFVLRCRKVRAIS